MRYFTAGESHGPKLTAIIEGVPAGLRLSTESINVELKRRQAGYGRGERMKIEADRVEISSGVRHGKTLGSPITLTVENQDYKNWHAVMETAEVDESVKSENRLTRPRPGHADLVGGMKYDFDDLRNVLERSSARETAMRVAVGAVAKQILKALDIEIANHIVNFGGLDIELPDGLTVGQILETAKKNDLSIVIDSQAGRIRKYIHQIKHQGDSIGGVIEVRVENVPAGLGSYVHYDRKLDGKIAQAVIGINAIKGVEFGLGFEAGKRQGSAVMDEIIWSKDKGFARTTNSLGGFEGGMTNGEDLIIRAVMKPIPTLYKPLMSVDIEKHEAYEASVERSDSTALPAAGVVMENVIATVLAQEICDKFNSDTLAELKKAVTDYRERLKTY